VLKLHAVLTFQVVDERSHGGVVIHTAALHGVDALVAAKQMLKRYSRLVS
jgi:hypothetical protein